MIYEGTNRCIGIAGGLNGPNNFFSTTGVATSIDNGVTWATYAADAVPLPSQSTVGPHAPIGAFGNAVCIGSDCLTPRPTNYGRYPAIGPPIPISTLIARLGPKNLPSNVGDSQPAAFIDDVRPDGADEDNLFLPDERARALPYLYVVNVYNPGKRELGNPQLPNVNFDLVVARAQLNGGTAPLQFDAWFDGAFHAGAGFGPSSRYQTPLFRHRGVVRSSGVSGGASTPTQLLRLSPSLFSYLGETRRILAHVHVLRRATRSRARPTTAPRGSTPRSMRRASTIASGRVEHAARDRRLLERVRRGALRPRTFDGWYPSFMSLAEGRAPLDQRVHFLHGRLRRSRFSTPVFVASV